MEVYDLKNAKRIEVGQIIDIPVSFDTYKDEQSKKYTTGFVKAEFVEYVGDEKALIRYDTNLFIVKLSEVIV